MKCTSAIFNALLLRFKQIANNPKCTVTVEDDGGFCFYLSGSCNRVYKIIKYPENKHYYYVYVLGCCLYLNEEQYTRLRLLAIETANKNEERIIKHLIDESISNQQI